MFGNKLKKVNAWSIQHGVRGVLFACLLFAWSFSGMPGQLFVGLAGLFVFWVTFISTFSRIVRKNSFENRVNDINALITEKLEILDKKQGTAISKIEEKLDFLSKLIEKEKKERTEEIKTAVLVTREESTKQDDIEAVVQRFIEDYIAKTVENIRTDLFKALENEKSEQKKNFKNEKEILLEKIKTSSKKLFNALDTEKKERSESIEVLRKEQKNFDPKNFQESLQDLVKGLKKSKKEKGKKAQSFLSQAPSRDRVLTDKAALADINSSFQEDDGFISDFDYIAEEGEEDALADTEVDTVVLDQDIADDSEEDGYNAAPRPAVTVKEKTAKKTKKAKKAKKTKKAKKSKKKTSK